MSAEAGRWHGQTATGNAGEPGQSTPADTHRPGLTEWTVGGQAPPLSVALFTHHWSAHHCLDHNPERLAVHFPTSQLPCAATTSGPRRRSG